MQTPTDSSITVVEPHVETYADTNINEKNLSTQYIYTTEGQLIPTNGDPTTTTLDLNAQQYDTVHVTEAQNIQIQQVDYQYEQQYSEDTVPEVVATTEFVQTQHTEYIIEQPAYETTSEEVQAPDQQAFGEQQPATYEFTESPQVETTYVTAEQPSEEKQVTASGTLQSESSNNVEQASPAAVESAEPDKSAIEYEIVDDNDDEVEMMEEKVEDAKATAVEAGTEESTNINNEVVENVVERVVIEEDMDNSTEGINAEAEEAMEVVQTEETIETESDTGYIEEVAAETVVDSSETNKTEVVPKPLVPSKSRGRKVKDEIPLHILGRDVNKPLEKFVNGKTPKPRLGVKVPYRNLTSQIVSKAEIEKEIVERGRKKQVERNVEKAFVGQITSRLAEKLAPAYSKVTSLQKKSKEDVQVEVDNNDNEDDHKSKDRIDNNSDLLAILEGDGDTEEITQMPSPPNKQSTPTDETNLKNLEREIALQQLQDLPYLTPKTTFVKNNKFKVYSANKEEEKTAAEEKPKVFKSPIKTNLSRLQAEPQVKVNMALKTYSRKRRSSEMAYETPSKKVTVQHLEPTEVKQPSGVNPSAYVTKSSRVIKKKVIWDPAESSAKPKPSSVKDTPPKTIQVKSDVKSMDSPKKSVVEAKAKPEKKVEEKATPTKKPTHTVPKPIVKVKKSRSEVDKLLGDEGAIKMLYGLKNSDSGSSPVEEKRKKAVFSVEKTFKDLAKKANQIKSDLVNTSSTDTVKFLRKKDGGGTPPKSVVPGGISRQKSKDSARSTPPPSPAFSYPNEVTYLIRRRSSSSISTDDDTGGSMDIETSEDSEEDLGRQGKKHPISTTSDPLKIKKSKKGGESDKLLQKKAENRIGHYKTFTFKKTSRAVHIDLYTGDNSHCYFTSELLTELTAALNKIAKEKDCSVVLIRSTKSAIFSAGLNYKQVISDKENVRKTKAGELADRVRNFIKCLLDFPKILIAGIQGECCGLAVTMLPLFDIVIASDDATFSTSYSALGCAAEAGFLLTVPHVSSYGLAGELLYASQTLTADEAFRRGLISKLCWPEKYQETIKAIVSAVCVGSKQSLESTKMQLRSTVRQQTNEALDAMVPELVGQWASAECQKNFAQID